MSRSLTSLLLLVIAATAFANLNCLDRKGNAVSWFTAIRYPGALTASNPRYAYLDINSGSSFEVVSGVNVDDQAEPLAKTIGTINALTGDNKNLLVLTNTPPNGTLINTGAHAKAIIAFDNQTQTGVYILYSFLSYPNVGTDGTIDATIPLTGNPYAEMNGPDGNYLYCISFDVELLNVIFELLPNEQPNILYSSGIFNNMPTTANFEYEARAFHVPLGGDFEWFLTKSPNANMSMYDDIISNLFSVNLAVTSSGNESAICTPQIVVNIDSLAINSQDTWVSTDDNSKWGVGIVATFETVYLCDNDRNPEQNNRGGSCFVSANKNLYAAFLSIANYTNTCPSSSSSSKLPPNYMDILSA